MPSEVTPRFLLMIFLSLERRYREKRARRDRETIGRAITVISLYIFDRPGIEARYRHRPMAA